MSASRVLPSLYKKSITVLPETQKPRFLNSEGDSSIDTVFDGDAQRQLDAIWEFFIQLNGE